MKKQFLTSIPVAEIQQNEIYRIPERKLPEVSAGLQKLTTEQLDYRTRRQEAQRAMSYSPSKSINPNDFKQMVLTRPQDDGSKFDVQASKTIKNKNQQSQPEPVRQQAPINYEAFEVNFFDRYKDLQQKPKDNTKTTQLIKTISSPMKSRAVMNSLRNEGMLVPYQPPDRTLVMALLCEYDLQKENGIPFAGSVRVQRKADVKEKAVQLMQQERIANYEKTRLVESGEML